MDERLQHIFSHDAILLLRNASAIPKLLYLLQTSSCFSHPHFNAMMMNLEKYFAPFPTFALMKRLGPKPHFPFDLGALAFEVLYHQLSLLLYTALRTLSTRSYHHVSFPQICFTRVQLSLCGHRAIANLLLRTKHPIAIRHGNSMGRGNLCSFVRPSL